jgi:hypothetical protein
LALLLRLLPGCELHVGGAGSQFEFRELDLNKTLQENGVVDESGAFEALDMPSDYHVPVLHVHWNDDLTVA